MALPVHAARSVRLRLRAGARAGRHHVPGRAAQSDDVGQSQRRVLRAEPRDRQVHARQTLRESELDERLRCEWKADPDGATKWDADVPRGAGRIKLVLAVVQST